MTKPGRHSEEASRAADPGDGLEYDLAGGGAMVGPKNMCAKWETSNFEEEKEKRKHGTGRQQTADQQGVAVD